MGTKPHYDFSKPLPEPYESQMPASKISAYEKYLWREHKIEELFINGLVKVDDKNMYVFLNEEDLSNSSDDKQIEEDDDETTEETKDFDETEIVFSEEQEDVSDEPETVIKQPVVSKSSKSLKTNKKKSVQKKNLNDDSDFEFIKNMPTSVMDALRKIFISNASKADLISAAVYIFTKGDCEISDKAMKLVESYDAENQLDSIEDRLSRLERLNKKQLDLLYSTELAACYTAFDRRYGATAPRTGPKTHEFREPECLDMLDRLREQSQDQKHIDELNTGREIYNQIKDKND